MNSDLTCVDEPDVSGSTQRCHKVEWAINNSWKETLGSDINLINPPVKDTITVPPGGYVVIRFKADNPGKICFIAMIAMLVSDEKHYL